jgi:hypothetical protein
MSTGCTLEEAEADASGQSAVGDAEEEHDRRLYEPR